MKQLCNFHYVLHFKEFKQTTQNINYISYVAFLRENEIVQNH